MNKKNTLLVFSLLITLVSFCSGEADEVISRSILVHVETDPQFMQLSDSGATSLLNTIGVSYKAYKEVLGDNLPENLNITDRRLGVSRRDQEGKLYVFFLRLNPNDKDEMVLLEKQEEILSQIVENFSQALTDSFMDYVNNGNERIAVLQQQADEAEAELRKLTASMANMTLPAEELKRRMAEMEESLRDSQFEMDVNRQLLESLIHRKEQMHQKIEERAQDDEVQQQMRQMMEQLENQMKVIKLQIESGVGSPDQMNQIKQQMIQARIEMARRAEEMRNEMGGRVLPELDEQIAEHSLDVERMRMKAEHLAKNLEQNAAILHGSADQEIQRIKLEAARDNFARTLELLNEAELKQKLLMPPKVIVIEAKN